MIAMNYFIAIRSWCQMPSGEPVFGQPFSAYRMFDGVWMPWCVVQTSLISPGAKILLGVLLKHCGRRNYCWPKQETFAQELGLSERSVRNYLQELVDHELIAVEIRGFHQSNVYTSLWHKIYLEEDAMEAKFASNDRTT